MYEKEFIVLQCPRCGKWTYAKTAQKTRFCSRCEKNFKINLISGIYVKNHQQANFMVKLKNEADMKTQQNK